jgi:hypothetical protein
MAKLDYGYGYNEDNSIAIIWEIADVRQVIENNDMPLQLDDEQCMEVLGYVERKHDANFGVSWDSIYYAIEYIFEDELNEANKGVSNG